MNRSDRRESWLWVLGFYIGSLHLFMSFKVERNGDPHRLKAKINPLYSSAAVAAATFELTSIMENFF
ncbi:hypothetical protein C5167_019136 [Papaver somniferum]|uniref:Uncharacterized protein n=1 Tax=Papaver somniferum TaxID=3469 RepID=A0A4Y7IRE9_PAPSO|nr:hypothetical protein C5167_019136 [Papaver somniferum]